MKFLVSFLFVAMGLTQVATAAITFQLTPANQQVQQGSTASFSLSLISSVVSGEQVDAIDVNFLAGAGDGTGGVFVIPTSTTGILGPSPMDLSAPGQAFASNFMSGGVLVPSGAGITFANLSLDTSGVLPGIYQLSLDSLSANSPTLAGLPVSSTTATYEVIVSAVPEPTSILTGGTLGLAGIFYRRRRSKAA